VLAATDVPLDGAFFSFDDVAIDITDFLVTVPTTTLIPITPYGGYDQFRIESASVAPGVGFATLFGSSPGAGQFNVLAGPVDIEGVYSAFDSGAATPPAVNLSVPFTDDSLLNSSINTGTGDFELLGVTLTTLPGSAFGETADLQVKADIFFTGVVPEPSTAGLMGLGLLGLAWRARRRGRRDL
jgi:hypothetical protein